MLMDGARDGVAPSQPFHALGNRAAADHDDLAALPLTQLRPFARTTARWLAASRPRPSSVTRLEPTLMTMRRAVEKHGRGGELAGHGQERFRGRIQPWGLRGASSY